LYRIIRNPHGRPRIAGGCQARIEIGCFLHPPHAKNTPSARFYRYENFVKRSLNMNIKTNSLRSWWLLGLSVAALLLVGLGCASIESSAQADTARLAASPVNPSASVVAVQDDNDQGQTIQLIGIVESLTGTTAVVNGLTVETGSTTSDGPLAVGATIQVQGRQSAGGVVAAEHVWILQPPAEPSLEVASAMIPFVIEGPVQAISGNRVRVHGFDLELDVDARLGGVQVGDVLRISGEVDDDRLNDLFDDGIDEDLDDDRYVAVRNTLLGFLSHEIYASAKGQVWRDSGSCADAPPGWATASAWRSRCSGEFGGGPPAAGAGTSSSGNGSSGLSDGTSGGGDSSGSNSAPPPPPAGGGGDSNSGSNSAPPPPPPPAGGGGDSSSGSGS
jgi:hypothetical protein